MRPTVIALTAVCASLPLAAQQADRGRTQALVGRATDRMRALEREADRLAAEERTLLGDLRKLELDRQIATEELRRLESEDAQVESDRAATTARIEALEQGVLAARPALKARLIEMYKLGGARYARLLLSTSDMRRLGQASRTVAALAQLDRERITSHRQTITDLASTRGLLEERGRRLQALLADTARAREEADRAAIARNALIAEIDRRRDLNAELAGELQLAHQKLQTTLRDLAGGLAATGPSALPLVPFRGDLDWPVAGTIARRFAATSTARAPASNGIEIAAAEGLPVRAIHEGTVAFADPFTGFGNLVILDHGSRTYSVYANLLEITVRKGARVEQGETVGSVGRPPTGPPGLYFELRIDARPVDPLQWLKPR
ncbi:MAG: peptidoglycan DD-metalloendopeptidase family protein [Vicinamibacterales bacterium]